LGKHSLLLNELLEELTLAAVLKSDIGVPYLRIGKGEPLVLIHGLGEVKEGWQNQFELADQYELIIPDLRGHGEYITENEKEISIQSFAQDVIRLLKELEIESAHICGLSMGGAVAQEIYRQAPRMCRTLILVSTFHFAPKRLGKLYLELRKNSFNSTSNKNQIDLASKICLYSWNKENLEQFHQFFKPNPHFFLKSLEACLEVNNIGLLPKINVPTLIIGGQYDAVLPVWIQYLMHKQIHHSELTILRNSGHIAKLEAKESFNKTLRSFLTKYKIAG
jgi:3-oxoadipate enol-lactonase